MALALVGHGPWRVAPFAEIQRRRTSYARGVHRAEDFTGLLNTDPGDATTYSGGHALLNQPETWEELRDGARYRTAGIAAAAPRHVFTMCDAGVMSSDGLIYCRRSRTAVAESLRTWTIPTAEHPLLHAPRYPLARYLPGMTLSLLTLSGEGFYHFLLESIPRLQMLRSWLNLADHVLCAGSPDSLQARWLAHAGVDLTKVVWMQGLCHVACQQLLFTSYPMQDQQPSAWTVQSIREAFPAPTSHHANRLRIWVSRRDAKLRVIEWEEQLLARLSGFEVVELATLSPAAQIRMADNASVIAGPHGAGLAHVLFGRPGGRLIELFPHANRQPIYARLAGLSDWRYGWAMVDFAKEVELQRLADSINRFAGDAT